MPLLLDKEESPSEEIIRLFEKTRVAYLHLRVKTPKNTAVVGVLLLKTFKRNTTRLMLWVAFLKIS